MGGEFTYPKIGSHWFDNHSQIRILGGVFVAIATKPRAFAAGHGLSMSLFDPGVPLSKQRVFSPLAHLRVKNSAHNQHLPGV